MKKELICNIMFLISSTLLEPKSGENFILVGFHLFKFSSTKYVEDISS